MRWIGVTVVAVASIAGISVFQVRNGRTHDDRPAGSLNRPSARMVFASGVVEGREREVSLRFEITGRLESVEVAEGDRVCAGGTLARLEPATWVHELARTEASLALARAERARLVNGAGKEAREFAHAQSRIAEARLAQARKRLDRALGLFRQNAQSRADVDDLEAHFDAAQAELEASVARAQELDAPAREDELRMADAKIALQEAHARAAQTMLEKTRLLAPSDGLILRVRGEPGELVGPGAPGAEPTFIMADTSELRVRAFVEEMDALNVSVGQRAYVVADGMPDVRFWGTVIACTPSMVPKKLVSNAPGERLDVKVREIVIFLEPQDKLVVGLPVDVFIEPDASELGLFMAQENQYTVSHRSPTRNRGKIVLRASLARRATVGP